MLRSLSILPKRRAMIFFVSACTGKAEVPVAQRLYWSISMGRGFPVFVDYRYYPNQVVYHKVLDALETYKRKCQEID